MMDSEIVEFSVLLNKHNDDKEGGCALCDMIMHKEAGTLCVDCVMRKHSKSETKKNGVKYGVTLSSKHFTLLKHVPVKKRNEIGKCQGFLFSYYPQFGFKLPEAPEKDIFETVNSYLAEDKDNKDYRKLKFSIHHIDEDHHNDRQENLVLMINSEHTHIHTNKTMSKLEKQNFIQRIRNRNFDLFGVYC